MRLYLGSNRVSGGDCSIAFGAAVPVRLTVDGDRVRSRIDVHGADGRHLATLTDGCWGDVDDSVEAQTDAGTATLWCGDDLLVKLVVKARFAKLVHADFHGPAGQRVLIGADGALHLLNARNQAQLEVAECEFIGEAHLREAAQLPTGECVSVHGTGVTYTREALGQRILQTVFEPADMSAQLLAAAGISMN